MRLEQIKEMQKEEPFEPFDLYLADGRSVFVPHPEFLYIPPKGDRSVYVSDDDGIVERIDVMLVVSAKPRKAGRSKKRSRKKAG